VRNCRTTKNSYTTFARYRRVKRDQPSSFDSDKTIYDRPAELLQNLIRFDTTNPPGNEAKCIQYIQSLLSDAGFETTILSKDPERPNLIARLEGKGEASPLLLFGHVDVVTTAHQKWTHPPFEGVIEDGCVWGRGALDMKGGVAMMLSAFIRAKVDHLKPAGDVILTILCDEEGFGDYGAGFLVQNHADQFQGVKYAISEFGGFSTFVGKKRFYPIMISEKQICHLRARVHGPGGHGMMPMHGGAMTKLSNLLQGIDEHKLPVHVTTTVRQMIEQLASTIGFPSGFILRQILKPTLTDTLLRLLGETGHSIEPMLHNTVNATIVHGGHKINVIPSEITVEIDGRVLPGFGPQDLISELRPIVGDETELEVVRFDQGPSDPNMGMFNLLAEVLRNKDPEGQPLPYLMTGITDARYFSRLGIQTYGFLPMNLPKDFNLIKMAHAENERIPVEALPFGAEAIYDVLQSFG